MGAYVNGQRYSVVDGGPCDKIAEEISDLKSQLNDISQFVHGDNIFQETWEDGTIDTNGQEVPTASVQRSAFIPVNPDNGDNGKLYFLRTSAAPTYNFIIFFYTTDDTSGYIADSRRVIFSASSGSTSALKNDIVIPETAKYFRLTATANRNGNICVSYDNINDYVPYQEKINESKLPFYGKTIAFMGDSIIGNFNDRTGVCAQIAAMTGATVINCAFGGSRMAYRYSIYGDATPGASGYNEGATDAQKNQVDQYRYMNTLAGCDLSDAIASGIWTAQDTAVANMQSKPDYFEARLTEIKAIDWSTVDYILWEYGTNDFTASVKLSDVSDLTSMFAFDNAYRKAIETIAAAYPTIQIIPITPTWRFWVENGTYLYDSNTHEMNDYEGTSRLLTGFVEKAKTLAREYQLPCIDDYYTLGANKFTRSAFFDANDGTHPNADGRARIAKHIASQLDSVV